MEIVCTPQAYRGFESHSLRHRKGARAALFFVAERVGSHTCAFLNAQGAQVCAKRKPDEPYKSHSVERSKNKE